MFEFSGSSFDSGVSLKLEFSVSSGVDSVVGLVVVSLLDPRTPGVGVGVDSGVGSVVV